MFRFAVAAVMMLGLVQDPTKSLPDAYQVAFENDYVRIVRVRYDAGAKLADHTHPAGTTVYVYLNDSDGVTFSHSGNNNRTVTRPAVKAGAIRIATGPEEHHTAENKSSTPSEFLRILLKTEGSGSRNTRRMPPTETDYSNAQLRVTRLKLEQHDSQTITAKAPALVIELPSGRTQWMATGTSAEIANHELPLMDFVKIELLTKPRM